MRGNRYWCKGCTAIFDAMLNVNHFGSTGTILEQKPDCVCATDAKRANIRKLCFGEVGVHGAVCEVRWRLLPARCVWVPTILVQSDHKNTATTASGLAFDWSYCCGRAESWWCPTWSSKYSTIVHQFCYGKAGWVSHSGANMPISLSNVAQVGEVRHGEGRGCWEVHLTYEVG